MDECPAEAEISIDKVLAGRIRLRQPVRGYRAGMDAALLAAACDARAGQRVIEAGCGAGGALLAAAARWPQTHFVGMERDPQMLALARENITDNSLSDRVDAVLGDVGQGFRMLGLRPFDAAMANPPFFDDPRALRGPSPARAGAYLADDGLSGWIGFLISAVRAGGAITLIHRADRLGDILAQLGASAGSVRIRPVQPFAGQPAKRVLVRAIKTGKAPLVLLPALVLHDSEGGKHTAQAEALLRGEAALSWS
jgi:tRNA1(Val) A37 N6-methylase TrmN6